MTWFCLVCRQDRDCKRVSTRPEACRFWHRNQPVVMGIQHRVRRWECKSCGLRFNTIDCLDEDSVPRNLPGAA